MNEMYIISFNSTHHAIRTDKLLNEADIKSTTLPTPREITASCGISIRFLLDNLENIKDIVRSNKIEIKGIYKISKNLEGKKVVEVIE